MADEPVLKCTDLVKIYGKRKVVDQVSIYMKKGETVGLLGPNGAGKTTTFYMIVGMIRPTRARSTSMIRRSPHCRCTVVPVSGIGYLPQEASVFRRMTVEENILAILETLRR